MKILHGESQILRGLKQWEGLSYTVEEVPSYVDATEVPYTYGDIDYIGVTMSGVANNCKLHVAVGLFAGDISFESLAPETANVDAIGNVTRVETGPATIAIRNRISGEVRFSRTMYISDSSQTARFVEFKAGSLGAHCVAQMKALISGKSPSSGTQRYWESNNGSTASPAGTLNSNNFAAGIDLSGMSMCMSGRTSERFPVMLISSRHAITANHVCPAIGTVVVFRRSNGSFQSVTIAGVSPLANADLVVIYFNAAITGITPFKTMPADFGSTYAPSLVGGPTPFIAHAEWPALQKNVWNTAGQSESWLAISNCTHSNDTYSHTYPPLDEELNPWWNQVRGGDSGSPQFFIINGAPVLMTCHATAMSSFGISNNTDAINSKMNELAGTLGVYALTHPDLSGFNTYP